MSVKNRPKIISHDQPNYGMAVSAEKNILWPCYAYKVTLPHTKKRALNIFEQTLLRLTAIGTGDTSHLADLMSMEKELVSFIQRRLHHLNQLDDRFEITEDGKDLLDSWSESSKIDDAYISATVYVDALSGQVLPYIQTEQEQYQEIKSLENSYIHFFTGTQGKGKDVGAHIIHTDRQHSPRSPDSHAVAKAITEFTKYYKRYALLRQSAKEQPFLFTAAQAISVQTSAELVHIHCRVILQQGRTDFIVTDGFGLGFSETFTDYLSKQNFDWLIRLKEKALRQELGHTTDSDAQPSAKQSRYPEVFSSLKSALTVLKVSDGKDTKSSNIERDIDKQLEIAITKLYDALEWTLRYVLMEYPVDHWQTLWAKQDSNDTTQLLRQLTKEKVGFVVDEHNKHILRVQKGKIREIEFGSPELQPLLALTIVAASENQYHPIKVLARKHPHSLHDIALLKKQRDHIQHGDAERPQLSLDQLKSGCEKMNDIIRVLLPKLESIQPKNAKGQSTEDIDQSRMRAIIALDNALGSAYVYHLKKSIVEALITVEELLMQVHQKTEVSSEIRLRLVNLYANILQQLFYDAYSNKPPSTVLLADMVQEWMKKLINLQVITNEQQAPRTLYTVNKKRLHRAVVEGGDSTLGANFIALTLRFSEADVRTLFDKCPYLLVLVDQVIVLRGHGNGVSVELMALSEQIFIDLKNQIFNIVKALKGA